MMNSKRTFGPFIFAQLHLDTMIRYREATAEDAEQIAQLHSFSWQQNYRGIWRDDFLDGPVFDNRREVWQKRLQYPAHNQYVLLAESGKSILGFACIYLHDDPIWGTLLDNLHVSRELKGQGVGTHLIKAVARWVYERSPDSGFYLWVLEKNYPARTFYKNLGAIEHELVSGEGLVGNVADKYRYIWRDLTPLISSGKT